MRDIDIAGAAAALERGAKPVPPTRLDARSRPLGLGRRGSSITGSTGLTVVPIETPTLGDRSYLVHDGEVAFVVDPQRDIDRITDLLSLHQVQLTHVLETHIHNDYVTGGLALARATGAKYLINTADRVSFDRTPVTDGDGIAVGARMHLTALATPGHTFTHLSYALTDTAATDADTGLGGAVGVFSGGSLLFGASGRPDLLGRHHARDLARRQHSSAHRLAALLADATSLFPTHGFGSFCATASSSAIASTIGQEKATNPVLTQDEATYVRELLDSLGAWPAYYAHMAARNAAGPDAPDLDPPRTADADELRRRIQAGEWVVDLRHRRAFAAGHALGTLNLGLDGSLATYLGWLIPPNTPLTLLARTADDVAEAQRELVRIGIDHVAAHATGGPQEWTTGPPASFPTATFADLARACRDREIVVLDVRRAQEHASSRLVGAVNIPLHELAGRLVEVPGGQVWVHCASGYRASIAASVLDAAGRSVVAVDDDFATAASVGLTLTGPVGER